MICCPNWRRRMPLRAISGYSAATPKMLRFLGSESKPKMKSGEERWKKLRACDCKTCARPKMRRSFSAALGMRTARRASHALAEAIR